MTFNLLIVKRNATAISAQANTLVGAMVAALRYADDPFYAMSLGRPVIDGSSLVFISNADRDTALHTFTVDGLREAVAQLS